MRCGRTDAQLIPAVEEGLGLCGGYAQHKTVDDGVRMDAGWTAGRESGWRRVPRDRTDDCSVVLGQRPAAFETSGPSRTEQSPATAEIYKVSESCCLVRE